MSCQGESGSKLKAEWSKGEDNPPTMNEQFKRDFVLTSFCVLLSAKSTENIYKEKNLNYISCNLISLVLKLNNERF